MGPLNTSSSPNETVFLGMGSNLGDREANLRRALELLSKHMDLEKVSSLYETEPWGHADQPFFLNCVCQGVTGLQPKDLLKSAKAVESALGREPTFLYGPRLIDIDILFYGDRVVAQEGLVIPHPRLEERAFVLAPLAEIAGQFSHPVLKLTVAQVLRQFEDGRETVTGLPKGVKVWSSPISLSNVV